MVLKNHAAGFAWAPAGGATQHFVICPRKMLISTHGSCERGDLLRQPQHQGRTAISTHAPTGGATPVPRGTVRTILFLLAPPREGRPLGQAGGGSDIDFYSRPHGRGDKAVNGKNRQRKIYFYSRPHGRGDDEIEAVFNRKDIFLLAPPREGRPGRERDRPIPALFLLAPPREGRHKVGDEVPSR